MSTPAGSIAGAMWSHVANTALKVGSTAGQVAFGGLTKVSPAAKGLKTILALGVGGASFFGGVKHVLNIKDITQRQGDYIKRADLAAKMAISAFGTSVMCLSPFLMPGGFMASIAMGAPGLIVANKLFEKGIEAYENAALEIPSLATSFVNTAGWGAKKWARRQDITMGQAGENIFMEAYMQGKVDSEARWGLVTTTRSQLGKG